MPAFLIHFVVITPVHKSVQNGSFSHPWCICSMQVRNKVLICICPTVIPLSGYQMINVSRTQLCDRKDLEFCFTVTFSPLLQTKAVAIKTLGGVSLQLSWRV